MEEPAQARATPKRRREEGFTADVKAHAVERFRANGDAAAAARAAAARDLTALFQGLGAAALARPAVPGPVDAGLGAARVVGYLK